MTHIHPSSPTRAKLSTHLKSQYSGTKFDLDSATPLVEAFTKHAVVVDQAGLQGLMASQPDLDAVKTFAKKAIEATTNLAEEAKAELAKVVAGLKGKQVNANGANGEVEGQKEGKNVYIKDIHTFKAGLLPSRAPVPLEPLSVVESKL
jgi:insulysin